MSKYTTEVRYICENVLKLEHSEGQLSVNQIVQQAAPLIFDFDFPIFDEAYRPTLCTKILKHFYTREIGEETVGLWKLRLDTKLNEIMPYYNKLYLSGVREFNPLFDADITTEHNEKSLEKTTRDENIDETSTRNYTASTETTTEQDENSSQEQNNVNSTNSSTLTTKSETPQGGLNGFLSDDYLSSADRTIGDATGENESKLTVTNNSNSNSLQNSAEYESDESGIKRGAEEESNSSQNYVTRIIGNQGGGWNERIEAIMLISKIENIDTMIISELESLFMNIW